MGWLEPGCDERLRLASALVRGTVRWKYSNAEEFVLAELDQAQFCTSDLVRLASEQVSNNLRKVHFIDDPDDGRGGQRGLELRWYAVELVCDGRILFFKMKFERDSGTRLCVVSVHDQKSPWGQP